MLLLTRKVGSRTLLTLPDGRVVSVLLARIKSNTYAQLSFDATDDVLIIREEAHVTREEAITAEFLVELGWTFREGVARFDLGHGWLELDDDEVVLTVGGAPVCSFSHRAPSPPRSTGMIDGFLAKLNIPKAAYDTGQQYSSSVDPGEGMDANSRLRYKFACLLRDSFICRMRLPMDYLHYPANRRRVRAVYTMNKRWLDAERTGKDVQDTLALRELLKAVETDLIAYIAGKKGSKEFVELILREPQDKLHALVYADWLEERGLPRTRANIDLRSYGFVEGSVEQSTRENKKMRCFETITEVTYGFTRTL